MGGIGASLVGEGYDQTKVDQATALTYNYFAGLFAALTDQTGSGTADRDFTIPSFSYEGLDGETLTENSYSYHHVQDDSVTQAEECVSSGVTILEKYRTFGKNDFAVAISQKEIVRVFKKMWNMIK